MQVQLTTAAVRCSCEMRRLPIAKLPLGRGVVRVRPAGPKTISSEERSTIDSAIVSMMIDRIERPARGWIRVAWMTAPSSAATTRMNTTATGNGSCRIEIAVTAR